MSRSTERPFASRSPRLDELLASQRVFESVFAAPGVRPVLHRLAVFGLRGDGPPCRGRTGVGRLRLRMAGAGPAHARVRRGRVARVHGRAMAPPLPDRVARVLHACGERVGGRLDAPWPAPATVLRTRSGQVLGPSRGGLRCGASRCPAPVGGPRALLDRRVPRLCGAERVRPDRRGPLLRAGGIANGRAEDLPREPGAAAFGDRGSVDLLEHLGRRWYQTPSSSSLSPSPRTWP